jgi:hypothetical protein
MTKFSLFGMDDITCSGMRNSENCSCPWLLQDLTTISPRHLNIVMVARLVQILGAQVPVEPLTTGHLCLEALHILLLRGRYIAEPKSSIRSTSRTTPHTPVPWFILVSSWVAEAQVI